jgi:citrate lyase beta subunit
MKTLLYWPGTKMVDPASWGNFPPDLLVIDLEDSVTVQERPAARDALVKQCFQLASLNTAVAVRICEASGSQAELDLLAIEHLPKNVGVVVPKTVTVGAITRLPPDRPVWLMAEQSGVASCLPEFCRAASVCGFIIGLKDMCDALGVPVDPANLVYRGECSALIDAAHQLSKPIFAGVLLGDDEAVLQEFEEASSLGFDGVSLIRARHLTLLAQVSGKQAN